MNRALQTDFFLTSRARGYYAPDDPHLAGTSGYQPKASGGGGGLAPDGSSAPPGFSVPAQGGSGYVGDTGTYAGRPGASSSSATDPYGTGGLNPAGFGSTAGQIPGSYLTLSPAGQQAPVESTNVDVNPPYTVYPPGTAAPAEGTQVSSDVLSPRGLMMSAMMMPPTGFDSNDYVALDPSGNGYITVVNGQKKTYATQQEAENAYNAAKSGGSAQPASSGAGSTSAPSGAGNGGMGPNQFVAAAPGGGYEAVVGGKPIVSGVSETAAEQAYNQALGLSNGAASAAAPAAAGGMVQTIKGQMPLSQVIQALRQAGNADPLETMAPAQVVQLYNDTASGKNQAATDYNAQLNAQRAADVASAQQNARNQALPQLVQILNGTFGPAATNTINALLQQMGLPALGAATGPGVMPNGISAAQWDALPDAAKTLILQAWTARGGNAKDFQAGIDAQRPQGKPSTGETVQFAPVAA